MQASNQHSRDSLYADVRYNAFITKCHFSATAAPRCVHAVPYLLVSLFFSPFIFQLHFFFPSIFFPSFFFINYRRSHFSFGSLCACLFWMEYTGKVQSPQLFSQLFFPTKPQSTFHFLKHRSLCLWSYILMTRSSDLQTRAIFFFSSFPPPTLFGCRICEVEKNGFHC